ncbi:MAG: hypothetical protein EB163_04770 [Nitrososphaeria archaeon]|nr:hypothetical protein [Nitrososphaeria archaeon]
MSEDLINKILELVKSGRGDAGRLNHIVETLRRGSPLYSSDQKYIEALLGDAKSNSDQTPKAVEPQNTEQSDLREKLARGEITIEEYDILTELRKKRSSQRLSWRKNKTLSLILSLAPGIVGLQGLGYFQLRKYRQGIEVLAVSIIAIVLFFAIPVMDRSDESILPSVAALRSILVVIWLSILGWQFYDTKKLFEEAITDRRDRSYKSRQLRSIGRKYCLAMGGLGILALLGITYTRIF